MAEKNQNNDIIFYTTLTGKVSIEVIYNNETFWLTQEQIAQLFERERTIITKHLRNIFKEGELEEEVVCAKFAHTTKHGAIEGKHRRKASNSIIWMPSFR